MPLPASLQAVLPPDSARTWQAIAAVLPPELYLMGGTALAAHLHHRVSQDLDFFYHEAVDLEKLAATLRALGPFAVTLVDEGTLNGLFSQTKVQFLSAASQELLEPPTSVAGLRIAGLSDIFATKLQVLRDRGELRDYFDLMEIERRGGRRVEEGLGLFLTRYRVTSEHAAITQIVGALGYLDDVGEDDMLPIGKDSIEKYWRGRQPEIVRNLARFSL